MVYRRLGGFARPLFGVIAIVAAGFALAPVSGADVITGVLLEPEQDTTLYEDASGGLANGAGEWFFAGKNGAGELRRGVLSFDIVNNIPEGSTITDAQLRLYMDGESGATEIALHRVLIPWGEGASDASGDESAGAPAETDDATWLHTYYDAAQWTTCGGDYSSTVTATESVDYSGEYTLTSQQLIDDIQRVVWGVYPDLGWIVLGDESTSGTLKRFATRENGNSVYRPVLTIYYEDHETPECPDSAFWGQRALFSVDELRISDAAEGSRYADNFADLTEVIAGLLWYGVELNATTQAPCRRISDNFTMTFYQDGVGAPGTQYAEETVTAYVWDTGYTFSPELPAGEQTYPVYGYRASLTTPCDLTAGWLAIQATGSVDCIFAWLASADGDVAAYNVAPGGAAVNLDLAVCFLPASGVLDGTVQSLGILDANPEPLEGAVIQMLDGETVVDTATSSDSGYYIFPAVSPGT
ncbi:MAG TPA: carboxypeptidase regulatory-like domain-containing protein, partial [Candidatus Hydrogenedentes bacterium]|nr:carboxypeptidase regulatory-like domain-containing protein [Candidatus Hydrogenedentota bacterium]